MFTSPPTTASTTQTPAPSAAGPEGSDEERLLGAMLRDDPAAWREFNDRYARLIYRCITRVTGRFSAVVGPEDVREIYAMLFVGLLANDKKKLRSFEPDRGTKLTSWIGMLAIHATYDYLRSIKREPQRGSITEAEGLYDEAPDPFSVVHARQEAARITSLLDQFSAKDREFVRLYFGDGLEPDEVAERMGISVKTVYSKKHKIRNKLESMLEREDLAA